MEFKLSDEVKKFLDIAKQLSVEELNTEWITYIIFNEYLSGRGESDLIKGVLGEYTSEEGVNILNELYRLAKKSKPSSPSYKFFDDIAISDDLKEVFSSANFSSLLKRGTEIIDTEGILVWGILMNDELPVTILLRDKHNLGREAFIGGIVTSMLEDKIKKNVDHSSDDEKFEKAGISDESPMSTKKADPNSKTPTLDQYGMCMTDRASSGGYDPVIGRDLEIMQIIEILCCRKKNNAALLGESGCGKTAVVEGLAQKIASGDVPEELKDKRIFSVSTTDLQAGTIYRGQLEERIQKLCQEVKDNPEVIIYIDEFHQAVSEGSSNIAQMLKPSLGRGEINMIVSTTNSEYRKYIEKDAALKRRFEPVQIEEPGEEKTIDILKGIAPTYAKFHHVKYTDETLVNCVRWAGKYITDRFFPDKAIGIMDMAFSVTKLSNPPTFYQEQEKLEEEIRDLNFQIDEKIKSSEFDEATKIRNTRKKREEDLENLKISYTTREDGWPEVTKEILSEVISKISGVPIDKIMSSDMTKIREMKSKLSSRVIGQDEAVSELTIALQRNILGLRDPSKPIASFLLVGPTGVGKSLVSKVLAQEFFGSDKSLVTIACSEYMQEWAESKLLGSAPGYVGFSDTEPRLYILKRKPYCVLLVDEIEKSSKNLYNVWLNMLEEGEVTLSSGEKVSCRNCIIIFTGNVGTRSLSLKSGGIGFGSISEEDKRKMDHSTVMKEVENEFRPEFLNRLSKIIVFNPLGEEELKKIFDLELSELQSRIPQYKINISGGLRDYIIGKCEPKYGARSLKRLLVEHVEQEICKSLLEEDPGDKVNVSLDYIDESIKVEFS